MLNTLKYMIKILQIDVFVDINGLMYIILPFQMITKRLPGALGLFKDNECRKQKKKQSST